MRTVDVLRPAAMLYDLACCHRTSYLDLYVLDAPYRCGTPHTGNRTRAIEASVDCQGVLMSQTRGTMHTTWRSISLVASKRPRLTLCGTPGRDVLLELLVDGLGVRYDLRVIDIPTKLARGQHPRFRRKTPPASVDRGGTIAGGTVTSENYIK